MAASDRLHVRLDAPLPAEIAIGAGTAIFVCGWCFCPAGRISALQLIVDGDRQPVVAHGMPRLDPFRELHPGADPFELAAAGRDPRSDDDPLLHSYSSGFWGLVKIGPRRDRSEISLQLRAELATGSAVTADLARIAITGPATGAPASALATRTDPPHQPLVAICMATHNPPADLLRHQLDSIRAQRLTDFVCLISDDCSRPQAFAELQAQVRDDERFVLSRSPRRLGFYHNFERALTMVPAAARFVALADQDDVWHPDKLATLVAELGGAQLVYSDARIVARDGSSIADTYWGRRHNNHESLISLLVANAVTGAASLFRRELLDYALPFPPGQFAHYHDHWLALTALARGEIGFVDRPLYDYVQHGDATLGHATANQMSTLSERVRSLRTRAPRERLRKWRMHYFVDVARLLQFVTILELRCGQTMDLSKRRALARFTDGNGDGSVLALVALFGRGLRELSGRPETLGAEWMLFGALMWRRLLSASASELPRRRLRLDAVPPPDLAPGPDRSAAPEGSASRAISAKVAPLALEVRDDAPRRINVLIPTIDLQHLFGGYIAKLNLARRLAERGHRVRILTVDPVGQLPRSWARTLESYSGLAGLTERVEIEFGRESPGVEVSANDALIATTWWTAHIAHKALEQLGGERFLYLVQEYEPFTFAMGTYAALARESYGFAHDALFSTELLRGYFRAQRLGVYAGGLKHGDSRSRAFENAITAIDPPTAAELAGRGTRRLLFYARPEPHAARNLYELGVLALTAAVRDGCFASGWELHGVGTVEGARRIAVGPDVELELLPRAGQAQYARMLREHDLGLALMYTPHPSLVPIEMASAGMLTVTNSFENKGPEAMARISSNLITAEPSIDGVAAGLHEAVAGIDDYERRALGAAVDWSRNWEDSFDDRLLDWVALVLGVR